MAGAAALYLQLNPGWKGDDVRNALINEAVPNVIRDAGDGSPNLLLNIQSIGADGTSQYSGSNGSSVLRRTLVTPPPSPYALLMAARYSSSSYKTMT